MLLNVLQKKIPGVITIFFIFLFSVISASALPYTIKLNISSLAGSDFQLEFDLFDNNTTLGDSYVLIDNIFTDNGLFTLNFEDNTFEEFDTGYNPGYINVVSGDLTLGDYILRLDEDPSFTPTITFRDFQGSTTTQYLFFDFEFVSSGSSGSFGSDSFVASLLDPTTLDPLIPGLTPGLGDFMEVKYQEDGLNLEIDTSPNAEIIQRTIVEVGLSGGYPYTKIQDALDEADDYDLILVHEGVYYENIYFKGKAITIQSVEGPRETIIDGGGMGPVVIFDLGETATSVLNGFTIRHGNQGNTGGGIFCQDSSPTISNNIIQHNEADEYGGGIYCSNASPFLLNNTIINNMATAGGGIYCQLNSSPYILNNTIADNSSDYGNGIYADGNDSFPYIVNSIFRNDIDDLYGVDPNNIHYSLIGDGEFADRNNNLSEDPKFWKPNEGDFRLSFDSPCIHSGINSVIGQSDTDQDGYPRVLGNAVDLGPYEYGEPDADNDGYPDYLDCDNTDPAINPGSSEIFGDGKDNDCNPETPPGDKDDDHVQDAIDNCLQIFNPAQEDSDSDGRGDICDPCAHDPNDDIDGDGICGDIDPCPNDFDLIITNDNGFLVNFEIGRNEVTIDTSCYPYNSYDFLSAFKRKGDDLILQQRDPDSGDIKATYWFFDHVSGDKIEFPEDNFGQEDAQFVIDKRE